MRIAQVAPLYESVPPKLYGATQRIITYLTEELVRLGHQVTLFASADRGAARSWCRSVRVVCGAMRRCGKLWLITFCKWSV
jgi:hypothetical protein